MARAGLASYALELLEGAFSNAKRYLVLWARIDSALDGLRNDPRFGEIIAKAEAQCL
jgi:hypothetical protein